VKEKEVVTLFNNICNPLERINVRTLNDTAQSCKLSLLCVMNVWQSIVTAFLESSRSYVLTHSHLCQNKWLKWHRA